MGAVSVTKASDETVDGPSYKLWRELPPMLVERLFLESFEKKLSPSSFFVPSLPYQISSRPLFGPIPSEALSGVETVNDTRLIKKHKSSA